MIAVWVEKINKSFGAQEVLKDVSFKLQEGSRTGLVGPNGSGKTTLLSVMNGSLDPDSGSVRWAGSPKVGYLAQILPFPQEWTVWETMLDVYRGVFAMEDRLRDLERYMEAVHPVDPDAYRRYGNEYASLMERFEEAGGYRYQSDIQGVLSGLGLPQESWSSPLSVLSGGQRSRVCLARLLLEKPDVLLLDEPTNHLDLEAIAWLENTLRSFRGTLLVVSHDRWFLDAVCGSILEVSGGSVDSYDGNYSDYLSQREERYRQQLKAYALNQKEIRRREAIIRRYRSFNREKSIRAARSWERRLDKMERVDRPKDRESFRLELRVDTKSGNDVLLTEDLGMSFPGKPLFSHLSLHLRLGDRAALIGPNGVGKTTLLHLLCGHLRPTEGTFLLGTGVKIGYYDQQQENLSPEKTVLQEVWDAYPQMTLQEVRDSLGAFLFRGEDVDKMISDLSGGERGRVSLLKLVLGGANFLLLDEPTNHLDIDSRQVLEEALADFPGTILLVSHDRYFIDRVANRVIEMQGGDDFVQYPGAWSEYLYHRSLIEEKADPAASMTLTEQRREKRRQREARSEEKARKQALREAEENVDRLEKACAEAEALLSSPETYRDPALLEERTRNYRFLKEQLEEAMETWVSLGESLEL